MPLSDDPNCIYFERGKDDNGCPTYHLVCESPPLTPPTPPPPPTHRPRIPDLCLWPKEPGPCEAYFPSYFHNSETGECEKFIYGGCEGNGNRFETEKWCDRVCIEIRGKETLYMCRTSITVATIIGTNCIPFIKLNNFFTHYAMFFGFCYVIVYDS